MKKDVQASYVTYCAPHTSCCFNQGCPAEYGTHGNGNSFFVRCVASC